MIPIFNNSMMNSTNCLYAGTLLPNSMCFIMEIILFYLMFLYFFILLSFLMVQYLKVSAEDPNATIF